jgi:hypothetical protein
VSRSRSRAPAPALFVVGWLASVIGLGLVAVGVMSGGTAATLLLIVVGLVLLSIGLVAAAGSQGIERRARGMTTYAGPSPLLVFVASIPVSILAVIAASCWPPGASMDCGGARSLQALVYIGLADSSSSTRALDWRAIGPGLDRRRSAMAGAFWAVTSPPRCRVPDPPGGLPVRPQALPLTGEQSACPVAGGAFVGRSGGDPVLAFATTARVRAVGKLRAAPVFACPVLTTSGTSAKNAFAGGVGFGHGS